MFNLRRRLASTFCAASSLVSAAAPPPLVFFSATRHHHSNSSQRAMMMIINRSALQKHDRFLVASTSSSSSSSTMISSSSSSSSSSCLVSARRHQADVDMSPKFHCSVCFKAFRFDTTGKTHIKNVHDGNGELVAGPGPGQKSAAGGGGAAGQHHAPPQHPMGSVFGGGAVGGGAAPVMPSAPKTGGFQQPSSTSAASRAGGGSASSSLGGGQPGQAAQQPTSRFHTITLASAAEARARSQQQGSSQEDWHDYGKESYRRELKWRDRSTAKPAHKAELDIPDEALRELFTVWDKYGELRVGATYVQCSNVTFDHSTDHVVDESPSYATVEMPTGENPLMGFAKTIDADGAAAGRIEDEEYEPHEGVAADGGGVAAKSTSASSHDAAAAAAAQQELQDENARKELQRRIGFMLAVPESVAAAAAAAASSADDASAAAAAAGGAETSSSPPPTILSPFVCTAVQNPFITNPAPTTPPKALRKKKHVAPDAKSSLLSSASALLEDGGDDDAGGARGMDMTSSTMEDEDSSGAPLSMSSPLGEDGTATVSPFAMAMQSTSPFSVTESAQMVTSPFAAAMEQAQQQQQQQQATDASSGLASTATTTTTSASAFSAAASAESPFAMFSASANLSTATTTTTAGAAPQQQQQQQQQIASPFASMMASDSGAPLTPVEAAVDLSALFGAPPITAGAQQQKEKVYTCKVCGKNTFKSELAMITHCESKHGLILKPEDSESSEAAARERKQNRVLPDLPPYIPTPVDLGATAPYGRMARGADSSAVAAAAFWSEVELTPHARVFGSMTLLGEVTAIERGFVFDAEVVQLTVFVAKTETTDEEEIVVRCFGAELAATAEATLEVGCYVLVEGTLRLNPAYEESQKKYYANPAVHVSLPNGFLQRIEG